MIEEHEFKKHAQETLTTLQGDLVLAGDDYGFESSCAAARSPSRSSVRRVNSPSVPDAAARQIKVTLGARGYKLDWDIVENTFVHTERARRLKELVSTDHQQTSEAGRGTLAAPR